MIIVVNDASILIDLLKIDLSDEFFRLPFDMHTTDLVSAEITDENAERFQQYIKKEMIQIWNFSTKNGRRFLKSSLIICLCHFRIARVCGCVENYLQHF